MSWFKRSPPVDPTGFLPGDMVIAFQKRDNITVKARPEPVRFSGGRSAMRHLPDVLPGHTLLYLGYVEMKPTRGRQDIQLSFRLLNFVWKGSLCWISDDDAQFVALEKIWEHDNGG